MMLTETESKVLTFIQKGTNNSPALMQRTGKSRRTIVSAVRKLIDCGLIVSVGASHTTTYRPITTSGKGA